MSSFRWPIIAFFSWMSDWVIFFISVKSNIDFTLCYFIVFTFIIIKLLLLNMSKWKKILIFLGFPISSLLLQINQNPNTILWFTLLIILVIIYPPISWRDAPLYPTPKDSLIGLNKVLNLKSDDKILDFGSGAGHGIKAIQSEWANNNNIFGVENSSLLFLYTKIKYPQSKIIFKDMWDIDLSQFNVLYVFQRPDTMNKIWEKAKKEMPKNSFIISLSFPIQNASPIYQKKLTNHNIYIYQI